VSEGAYTFIVIKNKKGCALSDSYCGYAKAKCNITRNEYVWTCIGPGSQDAVYETL
jgi:hypothetical protein